MTRDFMNEVRNKQVGMATKFYLVSILPYLDLM